MRNGPETLSPRAIGRATLARQGLLAREELSVVQACERFGGFQAQEARPPALGLWNRAEGFQVEALRRAARRGTVARGLLMRGTLHLVSAKDSAWLRPTLEPVLAGALRARFPDLDVLPVLARARALLAAEPRTFSALRAALAEDFPGESPRALGYAARTGLPLAMVATVEDPWCWPPDSCFALTEAGGAPDPEELVRRHLAAFGPASAADVQAWSGLHVREAFDALAGELVELRDERGRTLWDLPRAPRPSEDAEAPPRLLPSWDSILLAHKDRSRILPDEHKGKLTTKNLRVPPVFLWDGMAAGVWGIETARRTATLTLRPWAKLPRGAQGPLEAEAEGVLAFAAPEAKLRGVAFA